MGKNRRKKSASKDKHASPPPRRSSRLKVAIPLLAGMVMVTIAAVVGWRLWHRPGGSDASVIIFLIDTVRRDAVTCYGGRPGMTPRIDAIAADGVRFDQAVSTSGWTVPAVASLLTGTWPTIHGSVGKGLNITPMRTELPVAPEIFKQHGYGTVAFATSAFVSPMLGVDRGFDVFNHEYSVNWQARRADTTITLAISELRKRRDQPTFYFIHLFDAHLDYDPPGDYATMYTGGRREPEPPLSLETVLDMRTGDDGTAPPLPDDQAYVREVYDGEMAFMDSQIGRFIDELTSLGLYDRSMIVVVADHGEEFWDHGAFEHGHTLYQELVDIPLIIKFPADVVPTAPAVASQVRLLDVIPTAFDLLDIDQPESFVGQSLMPFVRGDSHEHLDAYCESTLYGPPRLALRGARYKYIAVPGAHGMLSGELYDWQNDPEEKENLASSNPDIASLHRAKLTEWYNRNTALAKQMSVVQPINMHPDRIKLLRSLGYVR